jgi:hypothetical protein
MRVIVAGLVLFAFTCRAQAADPPLVEKYLHDGELARGEQALTLALEKNPKDDQIRFGLGMLQFARAVEHFGQALYLYGVQSENTAVPFLRLPVPKNDKPHAISYEALGRVFDVFIAELARAEKTLAGVTDEQVKLPIRLALVRFDLTGGGKPTDKFIDILVKLNGGRFGFQKDNPDLLVCFDRGDVAWLRAYCHLLSGMLEAYRAFDLEAFFEDRVKQVFPKVEPSRRKDEADKDALVISDAARLGRFRKHMLAVCELNRETWKFIRAETDDDHEWLPNAKQKGVLGLPVTSDRIDRWLEMVDVLEGLFNGERLISSELLGLLGQRTDKKGLNFKTLLDDPPAKLSEKKIRDDGIDPKYLEPEGKKKTFGFNEAFMVYNVFMGGPFGFAYAAWFN